ncbi:GTPase-associated system all-helical protein GASH [Budvicia aquatica]|uniref:GTPase-associated system helical domain-containing protein n=1 Tax=Budvicia aquatica TaxID=82979 RepID=A0A484ZZW4_9GAMM|nr:GTPase-associated system all-helical protein GASH [Budvicia aquatica]VFS50789.1 Uncharacterised protein [Budvicia aquatica]
MADYNFADQYRAAGLAPGSDIIRLRQSAFDDLRENLNIDNILDLTRIYFGLTVPSGTDWFRNAFSENDLSFSMIDNEREAAVLAVCLLSASLSDGNINAGLVPIVTAINRHRSPVLQPNFLNEAFHRLDELSIKSEQGCCITVDKIETPKECQISTDIDDFEESPTDILKLAEIVRTAHEASSEASKTIVKQVTDVVYPLVERVDMLREEVSMLWWYIGGWSRKLNKPFADLDIGLAALMAGLDLAHLTQRKKWSYRC